MRHHVYILRSEKDQGIYIGHTSNLNIRLKWHSLGLVRSTKSRRPLNLIHSENYESKGKAMKREYYLKRLKGGNGLKRIINK